MFKSYRIWYRSLTPTRQMVVDFLMNFLYWGLAYFVAYRFIFKEPDPLGRRIFFVFMLALLTTGSVNVRNIRAIFRRKDIRS